MSSTPDTRPYDLVVVGGGTAGLVGSKTAASLGARVLLVERDRPGGDCLWTGCVPSKSLLAMAALNVRASGLPQGSDATGAIGFTAVMDHVRDAIRTIEPVDSFDALRRANVDVRHDHACFSGPGRLHVGDEEVGYRQALIVTGAAPAIPDIPGLSNVAYRTSETIWDLERLPSRLLILGGGAISCELGQAFARLGSDVTLVTRSRALLSKEDPEAATCVQASMEADGVHVIADTTVSAVDAADDSQAGVATLDDGQLISFDVLLVALGRKPRTDGLNLDSIGVNLTERGYIEVDEHLRTSNPFVWAAGDVTSISTFTHTAGVHASIAATNAVLGLRRSVSSVVPRVTFTAPELAAVGASSDESTLARGHRLLKIDHPHLDRAITDRQREGFTKLVVDNRGRLVGTTIVGPRAGESLGEVTLAIARGMRTRDLAAVTHPYPTYNDAIWNAAVVDVRATLQKGVAARAIPVLRKVRSGWVAFRQGR